MARKQSSWFNRFAKMTASLAGRPFASCAAMLIILVWGVTGPLFHYSDTWQLVINTGTSIVTFLMVFLIQNTQNRDTAALQIKLDDVLRSLDKTNKALLDLEELDGDAIEKIRKHYLGLAEKARTGAGKNA